MKTKRQITSAPKRLFVYLAGLIALGGLLFSLRPQATSANAKTRRWLYLGTALLALFVGSFWLFQSPVRPVVAAACPFTDNDGNDADGTVGTYQLASNQNVAASATAYDCTTISLFKIPSGVTLKSEM